MYEAQRHPLATIAPPGKWWAPTPGNFNVVAMSCPRCGHTVPLRNRLGLKREDRITAAGVATDVECPFVGCMLRLGNVRLEGWPNAMPSPLPFMDRPELYPRRAAAAAPC